MVTPDWNQLSGEYVHYTYDDSTTQKWNSCIIVRIKEAAFVMVRKLSTIFHLYIFTAILCGCSDLQAAPSKAEVLAYLVNRIPPNYRVVELEYKNFSNLQHEGIGRTSAAGVMELTEDVYGVSNDIIQSDLERSGLMPQQAILFLPERLRRGEAVYFISEKAGRRFEFSTELSYTQTVNGFVFSGVPDIEVRGQRRVDLPVGALVNDSPQYQAIIKTVIEKSQAFEKRQNAEKQVVESFFNTSKGLIYKERGQYAALEDRFQVMLTSPLEWSHVRYGTEYKHPLNIFFQARGEIKWVKDGRLPDPLRYPEYKSEDVVSVLISGAINGTEVSGGDWDTDIGIHVPDKYNPDKYPAVPTLKLTWNGSAFQWVWVNGEVHARLVSQAMQRSSAVQLLEKRLPLDTSWGQSAAGYVLNISPNKKISPCNQDAYKSDNIDKKYPPGCTAVAVSQLINYHLTHGYQDGWLDRLLENVEVYPRPWAKGWGLLPIAGTKDPACISPGWDTLDSYPSIIDNKNPNEASELINFLWHVGIGLDLDYEEELTTSTKYLSEQVHSRILAIGVTTQDLTLHGISEKIGSLLKDRFRFNVTGSSPEVKQLNAVSGEIRNSIEQGNPLILSLKGNQGGHNALIYGYRQMVGGGPDDYEFLINMGWGDIDGLEDSGSNKWYPGSGAISVDGTPSIVFDKFVVLQASPLPGSEVKNTTVPTASKLVDVVKSGDFGWGTFTIKLEKLKYR